MASLQAARNMALQELKKNRQKSIMFASTLEFLPGATEGKREEGEGERGRRRDNSRREGGGKDAFLVQ